MNTSFQGTLRTPYQPALFALVLAGVTAAVRKIGQALKNRRDAAMLAELDDRMLADIGLSRSDLRDAYAEPLWSDPTRILAARARERRVNRPITTLGSPPLAPAQVDLAQTNWRTRYAL